MKWKRNPAVNHLRRSHRANENRTPAASQVQNPAALHHPRMRGQALTEVREERHRLVVVFCHAVEHTRHNGPSFPPPLPRETAFRVTAANTSPFRPASAPPTSAGPASRPVYQHRRVPASSSAESDLASWTLRRRPGRVSTTDTDAQPRFVVTAQRWTASRTPRSMTPPAAAPVRDIGGGGAERSSSETGSRPARRPAGPNPRGQARHYRLGRGTCRPSTHAATARDGLPQSPRRTGRGSR